MKRVLALLPLLLAVFLLRGQAPPPHQMRGPLPAEDGETCVVCYGRCNQNDVAYVVDGQRFAVMKPLEQTFLQNPEPYIRAYRPNSMQFQTGGNAPLSDGYLFTGIAILLGLLIAGFTLHQRILKSAATPAMAPVGLGKVAVTAHPGRCAACGGENHPAARACSHCGAALAPMTSSEVERL